MGLFGKGKQDKAKIDDLLKQVDRDLDLSQRVAQKQIADSGMDMGTVMAAAGQAMQPGAMEQLQAYARSLLPSYGWGDDQMGCLIEMWNHESGWRTTAENPAMTRIRVRPEGL